MKAINPEPPSTRVAVFVKDEKNGCGVLRLDVGTGGTLLSVNDNGSQRQSLCQTPDIGRELFGRSIVTTRSLGYRVGFLGTPNDAQNS